MATKVGQGDWVVPRNSTKWERKSSSYKKIKRRTQMNPSSIREETVSKKNMYNEIYEESWSKGEWIQEL